MSDQDHQQKQTPTTTVMESRLARHAGISYWSHCVLLRNHLRKSNTRSASGQPHE